MARTNRSPWPDVPRLLRKRRALTQDLGEAGLANSLEAFLAWKALITVARGTVGAAQEKNQVQELARLALEQYPEVGPSALAFSRAIAGLSALPDNLLSDWYCEEDAEAHVRQARLRNVRKRAKVYNELRASGRSPGASEWGYMLGEDMYAVRSAVIAHASVMTNGNVFQHVVPAFGQLAAVCACAGVAHRSGRPLSDVLAECEG